MLLGRWWSLRLRSYSKPLLPSMMRYFISGTGNFTRKPSSLKSHLVWGRELTQNSFIFLMAGKKKCRNWTDRQIPRWHGWVLCHSRFVYRWQGFSFGTWRLSSRKRNSSRETHSHFLRTEIVSETPKTKVLLYTTEFILLLDVAGTKTFYPLWYDLNISLRCNFNPNHETTKAFYVALF